MNLRVIGVAPSFKANLHRLLVRCHRQVDRLHETVVARIIQTNPAGMAGIWQAVISR